jgi:nitrite reductase/ring-hydroxylating ferredoxin subunit
MVRIVAARLRGATARFRETEHFVEVGPADRLALGTAMLVTVANTAVALFNVDGQLFAVDDLCIRCGSSLAAGKLLIRLICCSGCDWQYDVATGCVDGLPALRIDTFEAKVVDASIVIATTAEGAPRPR